MPRHLLDKLKEARNCATFSSQYAGFGFPGDRVKAIEHGGERETEHSVHEFIEDRTRIYRETWILPYLDAVIAWAEGEDNDT